VISLDSSQATNSNSRSSAQGLMPHLLGGGDDGIKLTPLGDAVGSVTSINSAAQTVKKRANKRAKKQHFRGWI
jgi:hypothetical protein